MTKEGSISNKRKIPFDQPIKITLLLSHVIGFSIWYGGTVIGTEIPPLFPAITIISGVLLVIRELYKDGLEWLIVTEGALTIIKVVLLAVAGIFTEYKVLFLSLVMLRGLLSSHPPEKIIEKEFFKYSTKTSMQE